MLTCFVCKHTFLTVGKLILHMKYIHKFDDTCTFRCIDQDCCRAFNSAKAFRKHMIAKHMHVNEHLSNIEHTENGFVSNPDCFSFESDSNAIVDDDNTASVTPDQFKEFLKKNSLKFIASLYSSSILPRCHVQTIINHAKELFSDMLVEYLEAVVQQILKQNSQVVDLSVSEKISTLFSYLKNPFEGLESEFRCFKEFRQSQYLVNPVSHEIGRQTVPKKSGGLVLYETIPVTIEFIELRLVFKKYFETYNILSATSDYIQNLNSDSQFSNFMQGTLWKSIRSTFSKESFVIPLFMYFDDYEAGNPLGSHSGINKLGAVYISFPCIPPRYRSFLENIFLALLFYSSYRRTFGNQKVFEKLIQEFMFLETEGIIVKQNNESIRLYFVFSLILGDNLGVHSITGFTESFSCNYCCRLCKMSKQMQQKACQPDERLRRTVDSYNSDVALNDVSQTGIKAECVFNTLPSFHVVNNVSVDIMHDVFEGVCHYDMLHILKYFINDIKLFSIATLNNRMSYFDFGYETSNKPPLLGVDFYAKPKLSMSASEMLCFVRYFAVIIGDLIPQENEVWKFYLVLRKIIDFITVKNITEAIVLNLEHYIKEHHLMYLSLFKDTLKPKHHHLLHYPELMKSLGPLVNLSSMRFESKHRESKLTAYVTSSRINICKSLAIKHQLKLSLRFLSNQGYENTVTVGPDTNLSCTDLHEFSHLIIPECFKKGFIAKWIRSSGKQYDAKTVLVVSSDILILNFGQIKHVVVKQLVNSVNDVGLICQMFETIGFSEHLHAYEVVPSSKCRFVLLSDIITEEPVHFCKCYDGNYVSLRSHL